MNGDKILTLVYPVHSTNYIAKAHDFQTKNLSVMCFFSVYFIPGGTELCIQIFFRL